VATLRGLTHSDSSPTEPHVAAKKHIFPGPTDDGENFDQMHFVPGPATTCPLGKSAISATSATEPTVCICDWPWKDCTVSRLLLEGFGAARGCPGMTALHLVDATAASKGLQRPCMLPRFEQPSHRTITNDQHLLRDMVSYRLQTGPDKAIRGLSSWEDLSVI
jgi:hypothetical protein